MKIREKTTGYKMKKRKKCIDRTDKRQRVEEEGTGEYKNKRIRIQ